MPSCDGRQAGFHWDYDRAEIIADGVVHAIGVGLGLVGAVFLLLVAGHSAIGGEVVPVAIYAAGLLAALGLSAAYNLWPVSGAKWLLRRFDHAAIYVLIAATYTPFLAALKAGAASIGLPIVVWVTALARSSCFLDDSTGSRLLSTCFSVGAESSAIAPLSWRCPAQVCGYSRSVGYCTRRESPSIYGKSCAFRTSSGMRSWLWPRAVIIWQFLNA